jgi:transposase-like protein
MPFRETSRMEERIQMFLEYESGNWSVSELCRRHGICRDTFYEWRKRKQSGDPDWFKDRSHAPLQCWQTTDEAIAEKVITARRRFPYLGPRKLLAVLDREAPEIEWPAGVDDRGHSKARRADLAGKAPPPSARPATALHAGNGAERRVERGLQGLVSHPGPAPD